jgi:hypothetical protein
MIDILINVSEMVGAIVVIIGAFVKIEKWTKGKITKWLLKPMFERLDSIDNNMKEMNKRLAKVEVDDLKLIIMSEDIPIEERLDAGERYISLGGNGAIKIHCKILKEEYEKQIRG